MGLKILKPGLLTTIQDTGRYGFQKDGVIVSGAMDRVALRLANLLTGNQEDEAALEITLKGPEIFFQEDQLISITGADLSPTIDNKKLKLWRPIFVKKGSVLKFGTPKLGCRTYLAVCGGFQLQKALGSYSTYLRAGIGGMHGKALQEGDNIPCKGINVTASSVLDELNLKQTADNFVQASWAPDPAYLPSYEKDPVIRAVKGPEYELFTATSKSNIWNNIFQVTQQSDRMGYSLAGLALALEEAKELVSSAVTFGTVQVPPQGQPIILMADHQTTGGYPRIAQVITADLPKLAQVVPGRGIRFTEVSIDEAQQLYLEQEHQLLQLKQSIQIKVK
ncbi:biotin-dependent carboxyltransferase family protein [Pontibacter harenae]|uniref:5-oxoprolinase subunit C family protein n=1 Tax=Pontibacter harenae TaxID=2894083 RepID=UPI001E4C2126|nr:biotin-dependent carboxyltransferase family protein [Pontibacter harenae]MCC9166020.1 biotin-dependent carboxyltransferase family protein [Pontibacter harenae]